MQLAAKFPVVFDQHLDSDGQGIRAGVERRCCMTELVPLPLERYQGVESGDRLDASHTRGNATLRDDDEETDVTGGAHVRAAAQFLAEPRNRDDANLVAV